MRPAARARSLAGLAALVLVVQGAGRGSAWAKVHGADRAATALCAAARATVQQTAFTSDGHGRFQAAGTWQASAASGVYFEYRIDSDRYGGEAQHGTAGPWHYSDEFLECGVHTARIHIFPMVTAGGRDIACLDEHESVAANFETDCSAVAEITGCTWRCPPGQPAVCTGSCTGRASGDPAGFVAFWGLDDSSYTRAEGDNRGPWTQSITCSPGRRVSFKVRDHAGAGGWSKVAETICGKP